MMLSEVDQRKLCLDLTYNLVTDNKWRLSEDEIQKFALDVWGYVKRSLSSPGIKKRVEEGFFCYEDHVPCIALNYQKYRDYVQSLTDPSSLNHAHEWESLHAKLLRVARFKLRNQQSAEDVVHEVYLIIREKMKAQYNFLSSPLTWIYTVLNHEIIHRAKEMTKVLSLDDSDDNADSWLKSLPSSEPDPSEIIERIEQKRLCLNLAEQSLRSGAQKKVIELMILGYDDEKIALELNTTVENIRVLRTRAIERIKKDLI